MSEPGTYTAHDRGMATTSESLHYYKHGSFMSRVANYSISKCERTVGFNRTNRPAPLPGKSTFPGATPSPDSNFKPFQTVPDGPGSSCRIR